MKIQNGFTLFEKTSEIGPWLKKQNVSRSITRLQVHHMDLPNYSTWEKTDKKALSSSQTSPFTTVSNAKYIVLFDSMNNIDTIQLEEGSPPTDYEPY